MGQILCNTLGQNNLQKEWNLCSNGARIRGVREDQTKRRWNIHSAYYTSWILQCTSPPLTKAKLMSFSWQAAPYRSDGESTSLAEGGSRALCDIWANLKRARGCHTPLGEWRSQLRKKEKYSYKIQVRLWRAMWTAGHCVDSRGTV